MDTHTHNKKINQITYLFTMYERNQIFIRLRHWNLHISVLLFNFDRPRTYIMFVHDFFERHFPRKLLLLFYY